MVNDDPHSFSTFIENMSFLYSYIVATVNSGRITSDLSFTTLSAIDLSEKFIDILGGHGWRNFFTVCRYLVAMGIYEVETGLRE